MASASAVSRPGAGVGRRQAVLAAMALASVLTAIELWAWWRPPAGLVFSGSFWAPEDVAAYWSAMREAATQSGWLIHDRLTPELHQPALLYPIYVAAAKTAATFGAPIEWAFIVLSWVARFLLFIAVAALTASLIEPQRRRSAYALALAGGGLGFMVLLITAAAGRPDLLEAWAADWRYVELSTFLLLFSYPHLQASVGATALLLVARLDLDRKLSVRPVISLLGGLLVLGLANSFGLVPAGVVLVVYGVWRAATRPASRWRELIVGLVVLLVAIPFLFYAWRTFAKDSFWAIAYGSQNVPHLLTPPLLVLLSSLGLMLPLGVVGAIALVRQRVTGGALLLLWLAITCGLMLLPLPYQRRFGLGMTVVLAFVASWGLSAFGASSRWRQVPHWARRSAGYVAFLGLFGSAVGMSVLVLGLLFSGRGPQQIIFESAPVVEAARWLAGHSTSEDVLLAEWRTANAALRYVPGRAFSGHPIATLESAAKEATVRRFFDSSASDEERQTILRAYGMTVVLVGPRERELGGLPRPASFLRRVYESEEVVIYRVGALEVAP